MDQLVITVATSADLSRLLSLIEAYHVSDDLEFDADEVSHTLKPLLESDTLGCAWLVAVADQTVGYLVLGYGYSIEFHGRDAFVDEFYLVPEYRRQGIGRKVLQHVLHQAGRLNIKALHLETARDNLAAQGLYRSVGFEPRERYVIMSVDIKSD